MNFKNVIGIDISKSTIDVCIHLSGSIKQFKNSNRGFKELLKWLDEQEVITQESLFIYEHTGMYSYLISCFFDREKLLYHIAPALDIKRSMGITRGKDDKIDAKRIALYGYRLKDEIKPNTPIDKSIVQLKSLMGLKSKLIKQRAGYKTSLKEQKNIYDSKHFKTIFEVQQKVIHYLNKQIKSIEGQILKIIKDNEKLYENLKLITSIKGIGVNMTVNMIITTENFKKFEYWRKFASYCGIAPFPHQSGSSIKGRSRVSQLANKNIKACIHLCAMSAIQHNTEMKQYYNKRIEMGKNKMSTINIIRNKLIARIFAVVKRQTPYVDTMKFAT